MCLTTQYYYKCGCINGEPTLEVCDPAFLDSEDAKAKFTYDHTWQYLHCKKEEQEYWLKSRICLDCKRKTAEERDRVSGSGNGNGNGKAKGRLVLENGKWIMRG